MRRKYGRLRKKENIIVFPGTFEKLVAKGIDCVELQKYEEAVKAFDQAIIYEPEYPEFLGPYAVALYETKDFQRAKEIASMLLHSAPVNYLDTMELYLTILIQLQEYEDVEMTIDILLSEDLIAPESLPKFNYLRELNNRMSLLHVKDEGVEVEAPFTLDEFIALDVTGQQRALASLEGVDLRAMTSMLEDIAESVHFSPLVITFALTLLHQANYRKELTVQKFGLNKEVIPAHLILPGQDELTQKVIAAAEERLSKDPSRFELAQGLIEKFTITSFPFSWGDYSAEEIATSYIAYIDCLFTGKELPNTDLCAFIKQVDNELDDNEM